MDDERLELAIRAVEERNRPRARELLSAIMKSEPRNPVLWIWMSAAVATRKERIFCLQTALKLDPANELAALGLRTLGALPPDEHVKPFSLSKGRSWEQRILASYGMAVPSGLAAITSGSGASPAGLLVAVVGVCGLAAFMLLGPRLRGSDGQAGSGGLLSTPRATTTFVNAGNNAQSALPGPPPLWMLLSATYTPTPLYVDTPHAGPSVDQYRASMMFYGTQDWDNFIVSMRELSRLEPAAADVPYYIGEAYRFQGLHRQALRAYEESIQIDPGFGPAYLGLARARRMQDPNASVDALYGAALERDPDFGEVYVDRAGFHYDRGELEDALGDLGSAEALMPSSPDVQLGYARVFLAMDRSSDALARAQRAHDLDQTNLEAYLLLGQAALQEAKYEEAMQALETYIQYEPEDASALNALGEAGFQLGKYEQAVVWLNRAIPSFSPGRVRDKAYLQRGLSHLELGGADLAVTDLENAYDSQADSFVLNLGLARAYFLQGKYGTAFLKLQQTATLADSNEELGQVYYWRAFSQERRGEPASALADWKTLLELPLRSTTRDMRAEAQRHVLALVASGPTPVGTRRPTLTPTPSRTATATTVVTRTAPGFSTP